MQYSSPAYCMRAPGEERHDIASNFENTYRALVRQSRNLYVTIAQNNRKVIKINTDVPME